VVALATVYLALMLFALSAYVFFFVGALTVGPWFIYSGLRDLNLYVKIQRLLPTAKIAGAAIGLSKFQGIVKASTCSVAPISGVPCHFWRLLVTKAQGEDAKVTIVDFKGGDLSLLTMTDESGSISVWSEDAEFGLRSDMWTSRADRGGLTKEAISYLKVRGIVWPPRPQDPYMEIIEHRLEVGDSYTAVGTVYEVSIVLQSLDAESPAHSRLSSLPPESILLWKGAGKLRIPFLLKRGKDITPQHLQNLLSRACLRFAFGAFLFWMVYLAPKT